MRKFESFKNTIQQMVMIPYNMNSEWSKLKEIILENAIKKKKKKMVTCNKLILSRFRINILQ